MKKSTIIKTSLLLLFVGVSISFTSCKKKGCTDSKATNYDSEAKKDDESCKYPPVVTVCISDDITGNYTGNGTQNGVQNVNMNLVFTKLSCVTCKIETGGITENITKIDESSLGSYTGKDSDGNSVSFSFNGNELSVSTDEIEFTGYQ